MISYAHNAFSIQAPESGLWTITIHDDEFVYRKLKMHVEQGDSLLEWDGCGYNGEKLIQMTYHISSVLEGDSGKTYELCFDSPLEYYNQALLFALPSDNTVSLSDPDSWFLEVKSVTNGILQVEMINTENREISYKYQRDLAARRICSYTFSQLCGKNVPVPGTYEVIALAAENPEYTHEFILTVTEQEKAEASVAVTGNIMPERNWTDAEIWRAMMKPAVVVDIDYLEHQEVYEKPNPESTVLGTLHGQTQCLSVFEIDQEWVKIGAWNHEEAEYMEGWVPLHRLKTVQPQNGYGILVDKKEQTLSVFRDGEKIETLQVCTGRMEENALFQETAAGCFLTGLHRVDYSSKGLKYDFVIQYDGGNLLHQIPYQWGGKKDFTEGQGTLGAKASHACIRIQAEPGQQSGINAYWIWTHIPYHTPVIILDDPKERRAEKAILTGEILMTEAEYRRQEQAEEQQEKEICETVKITFGGDAVLGGRENYFKNPDSFMAYVNEKGYSYPFSRLIQIFGSDDLTSVNLECVLKSTSEGEDKKKQWRFRGLPEYANVLTDGSVELVNVANNHTIDYGEEGYHATLEALDGTAFVCGKENYCVHEIKGHLFGFAGCRETDYKNDPSIIFKDIGELKKTGCEIIVYQCHWGTEYEGRHNALQEAMARACVRAGADLVVGHHPHVVQGIDWIEGVPVIYSLGNLVFGGTLKLQTYDAALAQVFFDFGEEDKAGIRINIIPIMTSSQAGQKINDFCPVPAEGNDRRRIMELIQKDTPYLLNND